MTTLAIHAACSRNGLLDNVPDVRKRRKLRQRGRVSKPTLLQLVAAGEPGAVQDTLDRYSGLVWSLARRLSPTRSDAEDAVQEIFVSLWKSADRFDPNTAQESTFVAMIARRRLIDRLRRSGRRPDTQSVEIGDDLASVSDSGSGGVAMNDDARVVSRAFTQLSDEQQRVLRLSIQHGQSHSQIAESTGIPLGTVKTHARRGMIKLKSLVEEARGAEMEASV